ncbi:MAG: hypothetical protein ABR581_02870 [Thermoleophilaceae bacterium]
MTLVGLTLGSNALAAEVVVGGPSEVQVVAGTTSGFQLSVSATGALDCTVSPNDPATATVDTAYSIEPGRTSASTPSRALAFWANPNLVIPPPPVGCAVTWTGQPQPYAVGGTVTAAPDAAGGVYTLSIAARTSNPQSAVINRLSDSSTTTMRVRVIKPPVRPAPSALHAPPLPPPLENSTVNLLPVNGKVFFRSPRGGRTSRLDVPVQVPPGTRVDTRRGHVLLISDRSGKGETQAAEFWAGEFRVGYTRQVIPTRRLRRGRRRASRPITDLRLARGPCVSRRSVAQTARRRRRHRRRLWGRGRGRYRTRGYYGAGTVRGTYWYTENRCDGTLFAVRRGVVSIRDFVVHRTLPLHARHRYLVRPPSKGSGRG